jgi:hypothetical protein
VRHDRDDLVLQPVHLALAGAVAEHVQPVEERAVRRADRRREVAQFPRLGPALEHVLRRRALGVRHDVEHRPRLAPRLLGRAVGRRKGLQRLLQADEQGAANPFQLAEHRRALLLVASPRPHGVVTLAVDGPRPLIGQRTKPPAAPTNVP